MKLTYKGLELDENDWKEARMFAITELVLRHKEEYKELLNKHIEKKYARLVELGDTTDLSSVGTSSREGSSPSPGIKDKKGR